MDGTFVAGCEGIHYLQEDDAEVIGATVDDWLADSPIGSGPKHKVASKAFPLVRGFVVFVVLRNSWPQILAPKPHFICCQQMR